MSDLKREFKKIDLDTAIYRLKKGSYVMNLAGMTILHVLYRAPVARPNDPEYLMEHIEWMRKHIKQIIEEETYEVEFEKGVKSYER